VKYGINLLASLACAFKNSAETLLTVQFERENGDVIINAKEASLVEKSINLCRLVTGKIFPLGEFV
jgi:hypothetical protein